MKTDNERMYDNLRLSFLLTIVTGVALIVALMSAAAEGQILRRRRVVYNHIPVVREVFQVNSPDVYVIQNNSPSPLISQGNTQYT